MVGCHSWNQSPSIHHYITLKNMVFKNQNLDSCTCLPNILLDQVFKANTYVTPQFGLGVNRITMLEVMK